MRVRIRTDMAVLAILCFPVTSLAQKIAWQIPPRGLVTYVRTQDSDPPQMLAGSQFVPGFGICNPPVLLQTELDYSQRFITGDPASLWELAMHIAFDLRTATGKTEFKRTYGFMTDFGTVRANGSAGGIDAAGRQKITVKVTRGKLPKNKYPPRVLEYLETNNDKTLEATLEIERTIDAANGRVSGFRSKMHAVIGSTIARLNETWRFKSVKSCRYAGFTTEVAQAIKIGAAHIRKEIANPNAGELADGVNAQGRTVNTGLLALCLLTLIKSDVNANDPVVKKGFAALRSREITDTYSSAIAIMALEALYTPADERRLLIDGRIQKPIPRKPTEADKALIKKWADRILHNGDTTAPSSGYERRFFYTAGARQYDNSNSQYALLGLYSAHLCGVVYSPTIWHAMANHWVSDQLPDGKPVSLKLVSHTAYAKMRKADASGKPARRTVTGGKKLSPAGWPYSTRKIGRTDHVMPLTGSMACAGLTGLTICEAVLRSGKKLPNLDDAKGKRESAKKVFRRYEDARQRGYAWLLDNYSVRVNKHKTGFGFHFYYLYGLERACEIGQVALIGEHDWYFEGATMLLGMQRSDGKFEMATLYANCFAVLFLKQAAPPLPVITGRRR